MTIDMGTLRLSATALVVVRGLWSDFKLRLALRKGSLPAKFLPGPPVLE